MKYRIKEVREDHDEISFAYFSLAHKVQVKKWYGWVTIKSFSDFENKGAKDEALKLFTFLETNYMD